MGIEDSGTAAGAIHDRKAALPGGLRAGSALIVVLAIAIAAYAIRIGRADAERLTEVNAANLAETLQLSIGADLEQVDGVLRAMAVGAGEGAPAGRQPDKLAIVGLALDPALASVALTDAAGQVVFTRGAVPAWRNVSTQDFFLQARGRSGDDLAIAAPSLSTPADDDVFVAARPVRDVNGGFAGVVFATLPIAHFQRLFLSIDVGLEGAMTLHTADLAIVARRAMRAPSATAQGATADAAAFARALRSDPQRGIYRATTVLDGVDRLTAYRRIGRYPLIVQVGLGTRESLASWRRQSAFIAAMATALLLLLLSAWWSLRHAWRVAACSSRAFERQARRNQALLRTASDGLHVLDRQGRLVKFSDSFAAMLGRSRETLAGAYVTSWDARFDRDTIAAWLDGFRPGKRDRFETRHRRADGSMVDVEVSTSMLNLDGEELIYCSARDVTRRKQLEAAAVVSADEARSLYDSAPCAYHSLDGDGRYLHVNETELAWLGCRREELVGKLTPNEFLDEEGRRIFAATLPRLRAGESINGIEVDLVARDGIVRRVAVSASPVFDADGRFAMTRSVMYDITDLHRARERVGQLVQEQAAMLDNDLVGIVRLRAGHIAWKNQAMCRLFGYASRELEGASARQLFADDDAWKAVGAEAYPVIAAGGRYRGQWELRCQDGRPIWIDVYGVMLSAQARESMWMLSDITPIRHAYERIEYLAFHDSLTGLANRSLLRDRLEQGLQSALRHGTLVAACYIDLDDFKAVNDRLGHAAGDLLLKAAAQRLSACVRAVDTVCRVGGDEFVVLLTGLENAEQCEEVLQRIETSMQTVVTLGEHGDVRLVASIGVALYPRDADGADALLVRADQAMYEAKRLRSGGSASRLRVEPSGRSAA